MHRRGFGWLRAWARYDDVIFQAPSTWTNAPALVEQLVLHELTHCLLFQRSGTRETWLEKKIPLWFREGMAISNAGQAQLYPSLEDSALWLVRNPTPRCLPRRRGALRRPVGRDVRPRPARLHLPGAPLRAPISIEALMTAMRKGSDFETAFDKAIGVPVVRFQKDFENYLRLRAFRGIRPPVSVRDNAGRGDARAGNVDAGLRGGGDVHAQVRAVRVHAGHLDLRHVGAQAAEVSLERDVLAELLAHRREALAEIELERRARLVADAVLVEAGLETRAGSCWCPRWARDRECAARCRPPRGGRRSTDRRRGWRSGCRP